MSPAEQVRLALDVKQCADRLDGLALGIRDTEPESVVSKAAGTLRRLARTLGNLAVVLGEDALRKGAT